MKKTIKEYIKEQKNNKIWRKVVFTCAILVTLITLYLLMLPAITMESVLICELEHEHTQDCYEQKEKEKTYICGKYEHIHLDTCYSETKELICLQEEHSHVEECVEQSIIEEIIDNIVNEEENSQNTISGNNINTEEIVDSVVLEQESNISLFSTSYATTRSIRFDDFITSVEIKVSRDNGSSWGDLNDGKIKKDDLLKFSLNYEIPPYTLSSTVNSITYQVPNVISLLTNFDDKVYDKNGVEIGIYTIDTNGLITITFYESFIEKNSNGQAIVGDVSFQSEVSAIETSGAGEVLVVFNSNVSIQLEVVDKVDTTNDLNVEKSATIVDENNRIVEYKILVYSEKGTSTTITMNDIMKEGIYYLDSFSVVHSNGAHITPSNLYGGNFSATNGMTGFDLILPKLGANESYIITYRSIYDKIFTGEKWVENEVVVNSKANDGTKLIDSSKVPTVFKNNILSKKSQQMNDEDVIKWTIEVNSSRNNIKDYILSDILNGDSYKGEVVMTTSSGKTFTTTLPYVFPNTNDSYVITYTTTKDRNIGESNVYNKAILLAPNGTTYESESNVGTSGTYGGTYNPLSKQVNGSGEVDENNEFIINWTLVLDAYAGELKAPLVVKDQIKDTQYYKKEQLLSLVQELNSLEYSYDIKFSDYNYQEYTKDNLLDDIKYRSFIITFNESIPNNTIVKINYNSIGVYDEQSQNFSYVNDAWLNDRVYAKATYIIDGKYHINKIDPIYVDEDPSYHSYFGSDDNETTDDGLLDWRIFVTIPISASEDIIIEEVFPENIELQKMSLQIMDLFWNQEFLVSGNTWTLNTNNQSIVGVLENNVMRVTLPKEIVNKINANEVQFNFRFKVCDEYEWEETSENIFIGEFINNVYIKDKNEQVLASDSHTQILTKNDNKELLKKEIGISNGEKTNTIPYYITINPNGRDMVRNSDVINFKDVLNYHQESWGIVISLIPDSLKVYRLGENGEKTLLSSDRYTYKYYTELPDNHWEPNSNYIVMELPDGIPLLVEYKYKVFGDVGKNIYGIANSATLYEENNELTSTNTRIDVNISSSNANADTKGFTILKVDEDNNSITIPNVDFHLYKWNGMDYELISINENTTLTTDKNGEIIYENGQYNVAYKLVEINAASGYLLRDPLYFMISHSNTTLYPLTQPDNFVGEIYLPNSPIIVENHKPKTTLSVNKEWEDANGNELTNKPENATIELRRYSIPESIYDDVPMGAHNLNFEIRASEWDSYWEQSNFIGEDDAFVRLTIDFNSYSYESNNPIVTINGDVLQDKSDDDYYADGERFIYEFFLTEDTLLNVFTNEWQKNLWTWNVEITNPTNKKEFDFESYMDVNYNKTIVLNEENNWKYTWKELPIYSKNENGELIHYIYYVYESPGNGFKVSILDNDDGSFTVVNKQTGIPVYYELPATGGIGLHLYLTLVIIFIIIIVVLLIRNNKRSQ